MLPPDCQLPSANTKAPHKKIKPARFNPRFNADRKRGHDGNERKVFQQADGEVRLLSRRVAGEGNDRYMQEEYIGQQQAHAGGYKQLACRCRPAEQFWWSEAT